MTYKPNPIDTSHIKLPSSLEPLVERLAENVHDRWAQKRIREGWKWGPERNDKKKENPDLIPYSELPEAEKDYDRESAVSTIKAMIALGYRIDKDEI